VARQMHHRRSGVDPSDHQIKHARTKPTRLLSREGCRSHPSAENKRHLWRCGEGEVRLQGRFHTKKCNAPSLTIDHW
jgi:hypothetical protein